jgi:hypothetical protein
MLKFSHFAAPVVLSAGLLVGMTGCAHDRGDVPLNAREIGEGTETVSYTAPRDGTVYVKDDTAHKIVYSGKLEKGQMVKVDAKDNKVLVDGRTVTERDLVNDHKYRLYFDDSDRDRDRDTRVERTERTTVTREREPVVEEGTVIRKETVVKEREPR